jgi:hypothetical protein
VWFDSTDRNTLLDWANAHATKEQMDGLLIVV